MISAWLDIFLQKWNKIYKGRYWYVSCAARLIHFIWTVYGSDPPVDKSFSMSFSHTRHLLATLIIWWPRRVGRVQLDQPLADCRQPDGASSWLYELGYIVLEEERTDYHPGMDRVGLLWYIVEGGPGRGKDMTAQGLGTHPGWLAHVRGAMWRGKIPLGTGYTRWGECYWQ